MWRKSGRAPGCRPRRPLGQSIASPPSIRLWQDVSGKWLTKSGITRTRQARALVSGRSRIFGLIVSEITNPFFPEIVQCFADLAVQHNYEVMLSSTIHDPTRIERAVRRMIERRDEGVAILTFGMEESLIAAFRSRRVPLSLCQRGPTHSRCQQYTVVRAPGYPSSCATC